MKLIYPEKTGALCAMMSRGLTGQDAVNGMVCVFTTLLNKESVNILRGGSSSTLMSRDYKSASDVVLEPSKPPRKYIVRRLTPLECTRLQGLPDDWFDGVEGSDSAKYKALGNGLALPCAYDVMNRIARYMEWENTNDNLSRNNPKESQEIP